jgi:hypothetical protein
LAIFFYQMSCFSLHDQFIPYQFRVFIVHGDKCLHIWDFIPFTCILAQWFQLQNHIVI